MSIFPLFPDEEYAARLTRLRHLMAEQGIDACLLSAPENIFYLCGLDHWGYFAYHLLIVPLEGNPALICRAMERVTIDQYVVKPGRAAFFGFEDGVDPAVFTINVLREKGLETAHLAFEKHSSFLPPHIVETVTELLPQAEISDSSRMVDSLRHVKSPLEIRYTRQAAAVSDAMMTAALETAAPGVSEQEIAAAVHHAMITSGGTFPGFGPFIRSTPTLGEEHRTWSGRKLEDGDALFVELAGCINRYHAPMGRLIYIGRAPDGTAAMAALCLEAFEAVQQAIRPGVKAHEVYQVWQERVDVAGLSHYQRHHCGYMTGIGFPPSWVGGSMVVGLRRESLLELQAGMVFHLMSWLMGTGRPGDYFVSDAAVVTDDGCERLTAVSQHPHIV